MYKRLKLMADYDCWPLWDLDDPHNVDPHELRLTAELLAELLAWSEMFDGILDRSTGHAAFKSEQQEHAFDQTGRRLLEALRKECPDIEFVYRN